MVTVVAVFVVMILDHVIIVEHSPLGANPLAGDLFFVDVEMAVVIVMFVVGSIGGRSAFSIAASTAATTTATPLAPRFAVGADVAVPRLAAAV
jgi:hypothetical protein